MPAALALRSSGSGSSPLTRMMLTCGWQRLSRGISSIAGSSSNSPPSSTTCTSFFSRLPRAAAAEAATLTL